MGLDDPETYPQRSKPMTQSKRKPALSRLKKTAMRIRLGAIQLAELKRLAGEHGTTLAQEIDNAIDAYILNISPGDIRMFNALLDRFNASLDRSEKALDEVLRATRKSRRHPARGKRAGRR